MQKYKKIKKYDRHIFMQKYNKKYVYSFQSTGTKLNVITNMKIKSISQ